MAAWMKAVVAIEDDILRALDLVQPVRLDHAGGHSCRREVDPGQAHGRRIDVAQGDIRLRADPGYGQSTDPRAGADVDHARRQRRQLQGQLRGDDIGEAIAVRPEEDRVISLGRIGRMEEEIVAQ